MSTTGSQQIIDKALSNVKKTLVPWPGVKFTPDAAPKDLKDPQGPKDPKGEGSSDEKEFGEEFQALVGMSVVKGGKNAPKVSDVPSATLFLYIRYRM